MNILIDIGHPAHVHNYRNLAVELQNRGHKIVWTIKDLLVVKNLMDYYGFEYYTLPSKGVGLLKKALKQITYNRIILKICKKEKIDIAIGTSVSIAHVSYLSNVKSILFDDDDDIVQPLIAKFVNPFASNLLSPDALAGKRKRKDTVFYSGYHELAYLHPRRFIPDPGVLSEVGVSNNETFYIVRFNAFLAHHDIGVRGLSLEQKKEIIKLLIPNGKVFITSEKTIEPELEQYQLKINPERIHSLMSFASLFVGDSQTMTTEAALLGTPALKCNAFAKRLSVPNELEDKYHLCYSFAPSDFDRMLIKTDEILKTPNYKELWRNKVSNLLKDKIDVTAFWVWFIENYPSSARIMKENPDYQYRFK